MSIASKMLRVLRSKFFYGLAVIFAIALVVEDTVAQDYEYTLNQRRRYDQIHVEIWAKSLTTTPKSLGNASLVVQYNTNFLSPASTQAPSTTDTIISDINRTNPIRSISSQFHSANGYNSLGAQSYAAGYYSLEVNLASLGVQGIAPSTQGRGSFVGKLIFNIRGNPSTSALTGIEWSKSTLPGDIRVFDADSNDIESNIRFADPGDFSVIGITVLFPNHDGIVVDRDQNYISLTGDYAGGGFPIYFERSVNPSVYTPPSGPPPSVDNDVAYSMDYSTDNGYSWAEIGRVTETDEPASTIGNNPNFRSGEIFDPSTTGSYIITTQNGSRILESNFREPLRVLWAKNKFFTIRSEQARLRVNFLTGSFGTNLVSRSRSSVNDINDFRVVLGRLFFVQLNGQDQYFKTPDNFSNSTQLTVETWINLNEYKDYFTEPGIVVSSGGPAAAVINGSKEGAWQLYLKDGRFPAFRAREIKGRGTGGYIAEVVAYRLDSLNVASDAMPLDNNHALNWVHIAATVLNNEVALYINGELVDKVTNTEATDIRMLTTNHPIWIGVNPNFTIESSDFLKAGIKGARIWRTALSQEQIRRRVGGIADPANVTVYGDLRRGMDIYYSFEGTRSDLASDTVYQFGRQDADFYSSNVLANDLIRYRPDQPHVKITAPSVGSGVSNRQGVPTEIRWVAYGLGDIAVSPSNDIEIEYSLNKGDSWYFARNSAGENLGGTNAIDVENARITWEPFRNNNPEANLRTSNPYSKNAMIRIRGTAANTQNNLMGNSGEFIVAPYFAIEKNQNDIIVIPGSSGMNLTGNVSFIEAWIRPYRFPTEAEEYFPIITKYDSSANALHYAMNLLPTGQIQLEIKDLNGNIRKAVSDKTAGLVRPNSISTDSAWTHIGAYIFLNNGVGASEVRFYIDGEPQRADSIAAQLGDSVSVFSLNKYPTYMGYKPSYTKYTTEADTIYDNQTQNVYIGGNINQGILVGETAQAQGNIYDNSGNSYLFNILFTKTENENEFSYQTFINDNQIPDQTTAVEFIGTLNGNADVGVQYTAVAQNVRDNQNNFYDMAFVFTKTANENQWSMSAALNGTIFSQYSIFFNANGSLRTPQSIEIAASTLNAIAGAGAFDDALPQNMFLNLGKISLATENDITFDLPVDLITFNYDGTVRSPLNINIDAYDLNTASNTNAFDVNTPKNLRIVFAQQGKSDGLKFLPGLTTVRLDSQDARVLTVRITSQRTEVLSGKKSFIGQIREVRFWNGTPDNTATTGSEPTEMTSYIQGAQAILADSLLPSRYDNLHSAFSFNGGTFVNQGYMNSAGYSPLSNSIVRVFGDDISFKPVKPYVKPTNPGFFVQIRNTDKNVKVRWVGFFYDGTGFYPGIPARAPSLEFSIRGGGGNIIQPYQYLGGAYYPGNAVNSISLPTDSLHLFNGTGRNVHYALNMDASIADPDANNDGIFNDQAPIAASLANARLRLTAQYTVNGEEYKISNEGPLFTITPASNFTIRTLLEGYHNGRVPGRLIRNIGSNYAEGGLKIKLYSDNNGMLGILLDSAESLYGFTNRDPDNRNSGNNLFANVNFVFTEINDGSYWVTVEHINHMPVMSRFPAPFRFEGDVQNTWAIESGWDFESWNGVDNNVLPNAMTNPWSGNFYSARYDAISTRSNPAYSVTGLIFNNGVAGGLTDAMPAMVGGDVNHDQQINAADRVRVRLDDGTGLVRSDVTGDGVVNADDRTITDRNFGKVSSLYNTIFPSIMKKPDPFNVICPLDPVLSERFNIAAKNAKPLLLEKGSQDRTLAGLNYDVSAEVEYQETKGYVDIHFYIQNKGVDFGLANCTYAITYNSNALEYNSLKKKENIIFDYNAEIGYSEVRGAPRDLAEEPLPDVRTIEIDYDAYANLGGKAVPYEKTYLGSLRFDIKNNNSILNFNWHYATSIHTTKAIIATPFGNFKPIESIALYTLTILDPNGGETISNERPYNIKWKANSSAMIYFEYTTNGGSNWTRINSVPVMASVQTLEWDVPKTSSDFCLIRAIDAPSGVIVDVSDDYFSLRSNYAYISKPSSSDKLYRGGDTASIEWFNQGYRKVRFEFSADGGETWSSIKSPVNADDARLLWNLPTITTLKAFVRMIDYDTDKEIARSTMFRILTGSVTFTNPRKNEILPALKKTRIMWNSLRVDNFDLWYSIDGGSTWIEIAKNVTARDRYLDWIPPDVYAPYSLLKAIWNGLPDMEYGISDVFQIGKQGGSSVQDRLPDGWIIGSIYPNPAENIARINITIPAEQKLVITLHDLNGAVVKTCADKMFFAGENSIDINVLNLSSGKYILRIECGDFSVVREITVVR